MAKLNTEAISIRVSELLPSNVAASELFTKDVVEQLTAIVQELVGPKVLVEVDVINE